MKNLLRWANQMVKEPEVRVQAPCSITYYSSWGKEGKKLAA